MADWLRWGSPDPSELPSESPFESPSGSSLEPNQFDQFESTGFKPRGIDAAHTHEMCEIGDLPEVDPRFEQLSAYLDGELSGPEARIVETWLTQDPALRQLYVQLSGIQAGFDRLPLPATGDASQLVAQVFEQVRQSDPQPVAQPCWRRRKGCSGWPPIPMGQIRIPTMAAALALLSGSVWALWPQPQPIISLEDPPVEIAQIPESTLLAEHYLLQPEAHQDAYAILFAPETN